MTGSAIRYYDVERMARSEPPPVPWMARPLVARGVLTMLFAPAGEGKSLLTMSLAGALATGSKLAGIECQAGTTVILDAENGEHEVHRRVRALGIRSAAVKIGDASGLALPQGIEEVKQVVDHHAPDLLVIDSLRSTTRGVDENDSAAVNDVLTPLRRLAHESQIAVLILHNANKGRRDYRGASAMADLVDVLWSLGREDGDPDSRRRVLTCLKMRVADEPTPIWLRLASQGGRVRIETAEALSRSVRTNAPVTTGLCQDIVAVLGPAPMRLADVARAVGRPPKDGSVRKALDALEEDGTVQRDARWYSLVQTVQRTMHPPAGAVQGAAASLEAAPVHARQTSPRGAAYAGDWGRA